MSLCSSVFHFHRQHCVPLDGSIPERVLILQNFSLDQNPPSKLCEPGDRIRCAPIAAGKLLRPLDSSRTFWFGDSMNKYFAGSDADALSFPSESRTIFSGSLHRQKQSAAFASVLFTPGGTTSRGLLADVNLCAS